MRKIAIAVMVAMVSLLLVAVACQGQSGSDETIAAPDVSEGAVVEESENAKINWTDQYIEARGQAVPPTGKEGTAQGKLLARRGAFVDLQRNLLEFIKGVRVDAETTMENFMVDDYVKTEVSGTIKNVQVVEADWDGEIYTVVGRVRLEKIRTAVVSALPEQPEPKDVPPKPEPRGTKLTGMVLDARHLPLIPAMTFKVFDENGKPVYGLDFVDRERFLASGLCDYQSNISYAKGAPRVTDNPVTVKAVRTKSPQNVDIVIPNSAAAKIRRSTYDFRVPCRVTVVKR
ncbi:MAG: hypothetical protein K9L28_03170 [Synergistales bacterium]|nr:hypothetical protein [Synergistales bacterium]